MPNPTLMQAVLALINAESEAERKRVLENQRDVLLTDDAEQLLNDWLAQSAGDYARTLQECLDLLARCRKEEIETAFAEQRVRHCRQAVLALINAETEEERKRVLESQREVLLTDDAEQLLNDWLAKSQGDSARTLQERLDLLVRCRKEGISAAFAKAKPSTSPSSPLPEADVLALLTELKRLTRPQQMPRRIEVCREALTLVTLEGQPELWGVLQVALGDSLCQNPLGNRADNLEEAIRNYRQALTVYRHQAFSTEWASIMNNLANAYCDRIRGARADNLEEAISYYTKTLTVYTGQAFPQEWAMIMNNLALAYSERIRGARADNLEEAIRYYRQALTVYTRQAFPQKWAMSMNNLGAAYGMRIRGARADNLEEAIKCATQALTVVTRQAFPQKWAMSMNILAAAYGMRIRGVKADNLEEAIKYAGQALTVYTRRAFPADWALTMNNLAVVYFERTRGARADNLEEAIKYATQALTVYTRQAFPADWARTMKNLANAYSERIRGARADNLEEAIKHATQALTVYTRQAFPAEWAGIMNNLANVYSNRIRGAKADNLEEAISHYRQALLVRTLQAFPQEWAMTMNNLALAYRSRIRGAKADNLEEAIKYYTEVLTVCTRQAFPAEWAQITNNLAGAYSDRIRGAQADNLEEAIRNYTQALTVYTCQAFPQEWAMTMNNLALAYSKRIRGARADNLEEAIKQATQALTVYTRQAFPTYWADTMNNLALAYRHRIRGARADNLEKAISHYTQALTVRTRQAFPRKWAETMNNLAIAYSERIRGVRADNLEEAIRNYRQALTVYTPQAFPEKWARTMNNLANAYRMRIRGARADNLEEAIKQATQALTVYTRQTFPTYWADTVNNLALAYFERTRGARANNLEEAIKHAGQALTVYTRQAFPEKWATIMNNLAAAYSDRIRGARADNLKEAISRYRQALTVFTPGTLPQNCRHTAYWLGRLLHDEERFSEARKTFEVAHEAVEALRGEVQREGTRRRLAEENADLYARLVFCCLDDANADEEAAFKYAAAGKGRAFVDMLASARFDLFAAEADDPALAADLQTYRELRQQIDNLRSRLTGDGAGIDEERRKQEWELLGNLQRQELERWEDLTYKYPRLTATQSAPSLAKAQAQALASDLGATLVEFVEHAGGWSAFVVTNEAVHHVSLSDVNDEFLQEMVIDWLDQIERRKFNDATDWTLEEWYEVLITPLKPHLPPSGKVVLAPAGVLHLVPLGIARHPDTLAYLCDEYALSFTPSLAALRVTLEEAKKKGAAKDESGTLLAVAYPGQLGQPNYLSHAIAETEAIETHFTNVTRLYLEDATPQAVVEKAKGQAVAHFSCHGTFDPRLPEQSGLALSGGYLTVQRIITELHLSDARLATLSACLTHRADLRAGEEHVGLVQSVLTAGARAVVASLWRVPEGATRVLFEQFYSAVAHMPPAQALTEAMRHVRQQPDWEHPFYWAAFQVSGLGDEL